MDEITRLKQHIDNLSKKGLHLKRTIKVDKCIDAINNNKPIINIGFGIFEKTEAKNDIYIILGNEEMFISKEEALEISNILKEIAE